MSEVKVNMQDLDAGIDEEVQTLEELVVVDFEHIEEVDVEEEE